eukprot:403351102
MHNDVKQSQFQQKLQNLQSEQAKLAKQIQELKYQQDVDQSMFLGIKKNKTQAIKHLDLKKLYEQEQSIPEEQLGSKQSKRITKSTRRKYDKDIKVSGQLNKNVELTQQVEQSQTQINVVEYTPPSPKEINELKLLENNNMGFNKFYNITKNLE